MYTEANKLMSKTKTLFILKMEYLKLKSILILDLWGSIMLKYKNSLL